MNALDVLRSAATRVRGRLLESLLVAAGVGAAVAVIASTLSLYRFVTATLENDRETRELSAHAPDASYSSTDAVQRIAPGASVSALLTPEDVSAAKAACSSVVAGYFRGLFAQTRGGEITGIVAGDYFTVFDLRVREGTLITASDEASGARVAVLGAGKARTLFPDGGAVGSTVTLAGLAYVVIGVLAPQVAVESDQPSADDMAFVPVRSLPLFERMKGLPSLTFLAASVMDVPRAVRELEAWFDGRFGPEAVIVTARLDEIEGERERIRGVLAVLLLFGGAGLLIASTNVLNVLLARAARRVRATGIEMALGAARGTILATSMAESLTLAAAGCLLGIALSLAFNALLGVLFAEVGAPGQRVTLTVPVAFAAAGVSLALNALLALYPAARARRLNAADAIRTE